MDLRRVPIDSVKPWEKNPRGIKKADFERLKKQITDLGVYKPLICVEEDGGYVTLGGNMRIRALKELGMKEVEISVVEAASEAQKIKYALSDNDRAGFYEEQALAELVYPHLEDIDFVEFKIDLGEPLNLKAVVERFGPDMDEAADDAKKKNLIACPQCGFEFEGRAKHPVGP
jgi:ParB-like chromosome segregation protein Spo0J